MGVSAVQADGFSAQAVARKGGACCAEQPAAAAAEDRREHAQAPAAVSRRRARDGLVAAARQARVSGHGGAPPARVIAGSLSVPSADVLVVQASAQQLLALTAGRSRSAECATPCRQWSRMMSLHLPRRNRSGM